MTLTVRPAQGGDFAALVALFSEENRFHADRVPDRVRPTEDVLRREELDAWATVGADAAQALWVCEADAELVGAVLVSLVTQAEGRWTPARTFGYVDDLIVRADVRGQGIGTRLMRAARDWATARGAETLELHVWEGNTRALRFYRSLGLTTIQRRMAWALPPEEDAAPIAQAAYDALAEPYAAQVDTKPHNAYYERPATLSLLPEVAGRRVLDAGCGPGVYAQWLVEHGAEVVACDANAKMVRLARERVGDRARVLQVDLSRGLAMFEDSAFDLVVSALVLDYVRDWAEVFAEFHRVLRPGGHLVFSMEHPFAKFYLYHATGTYFETELVTYPWRGFGTPVTVPSYRRPLSAVVTPLVAAGFALERILEPLPTEQFRQRAPEDYAKLTRRPGFMCVRARALPA